MVKHLPDYGKEFLLKVINKIWETSIFPKNWKIAVILPFLKPQKDPNLPGSYRPISLTSCVCKIMEKMVNSRLVWFLEKYLKLSPIQFGFRKNCSTLEPLLRLSNKIQHGFAKHCQTIGVFFDLEKAYDTTWRQGIIQQLFDMGIRGNMMKFINEFLKDRYIKVKVGTKISSSFKQEQGVPQGSVLSVTCFAVAINNITKMVSAPVEGSLYVDDFAIYCTGYDAESICKHLQTNINKIDKWASNNGFKFSTAKTVAVRFSRSRRIENIPPLLLKGNVIPYEEHVKFLGIKFDQKLTWNLHIQDLKLKVRESINILKVVSTYDWGADKRTLLKLYDTLGRSKLDYGCEIYSSACKTKLRELDVLHNLALRICTGAYRTSPVESLYIDSNELPLYLRREELGLRALQRLKSSPHNPAFKIFSQCNSSLFNKPRLSKPLQIRINEEVEENTLKTQKIKAVTFPSSPPWLKPEINCCQKFSSKKNQNEYEIRANFLLHLNSVHKKTN